MVKERPILFKTEMVDAILNGTKTQTRRLMKPQPEKMPEIVEPVPVKDFVQDLKEMSKNGFKMLGTGGLLEGYRHPEPYANVGDILWVRETWKPYAWDGYGYVSFLYKDGSVRPVEGGFYPDDEDKEEEMYIKLCDELEASGCPKTDEENYDNPSEHLKWRPSIFMPRSASRIQLEVTDVYPERLCTIPGEDALAEGIKRHYDDQITKSWRYKDYMSDSSGYGHPDHDYPCTYDPKHSFRTLWESINGAESWAANPFVWVIKFKRV